MQIVKDTPDTKGELPTVPKDFTPDVLQQLGELDRLLYFHWNLQTDVITFNKAPASIEYDVPDILPRASTALWDDEVIYPADCARLHTWLRVIFSKGMGKRHANGMQRSTARLRLRVKTPPKDDAAPRYNWTEIRMITYFNGWEPAEAFGTIRNIQSLKLWQERLERKASRDTLTGLLNKGASQRRIEEYLRALNPRKDHAALLLIDADGFKEINDTFGHLFGDAVLTNMGMIIEKHFRQSDVVGRIGGDEFLVLFRNVPSLQILRDRCQQIVSAMAKTYENGEDRLPFSISIGVSLFPAHGKTYTDLFRHADKALYEAKRCGKNQFVVYRPSLLNAEGSAEVPNGRDPQNDAELQQKAFEDNMLEFIFRLLYETNSPEATIQMSLGMFGKQFQLDRVAIDRYDAMNNTYTNAYEWVSPNGMSLRPEAHEKDPDFPNILRQRGKQIAAQYRPTPYGVISRCEDTRLLAPEFQPAAGFLRLGAFAHCLITHGTETLGCFGFESARPHTFTTDEIKNLNIFSVLLGNILMANRSDAAAMQAKIKMFSTILDDMQELIYIVDRRTMEPIYYNRTIRQAIVNGEGHEPCYKLFHNRQKPCKGCPVRDLSKNGNEYIQCEVHNWGKTSLCRACNFIIDKDRTDVDPHLVLMVQEP